jgi:hypothetical protein
MPSFNMSALLMEGLTSVDIRVRILVKWSEVEQSGGGDRNCSLVSTQTH